MSKQLSTSPPHDYATCMHADCPRAHDCLRHIAYINLLKTADRMMLVNPSRATRTDDCPYYHSSEMVRFARGFIGAQARMFPKQYELFSQILIDKLHRSTYFAWRRGARLLSPKEQQVVEEALQMAGVTEPMEFDQYEDAPNWAN